MDFNRIFTLFLALWTGITVSGYNPETQEPENLAVPAELVETITPASASDMTEPLKSKKNATVTDFKDEQDTQWLWDTLNVYCDNKYITAGILAFFWRESSSRSDARAGWTTVDKVFLTDSSAEFTEKVDAGLSDGSTKEFFVEDCQQVSGGYGLGSWSSPCYTESLYDYAVEWGTTIADAEMQCSWTVESMKANQDLWSQLESCKDAYEAGLLIGKLYDGLSEGALFVAEVAKEFYGRYA